MTIYDISQEVFGCEVYPEDPAPEKETLLSMDDGALYNLSALHMCVHNGTHVDAPAHFLRNGKTIEAVALERLIGPACVVYHPGVVTAEAAKAMLQRASAADPEAARRILIKGDAVVSLDAAKVFAEANLLLLGNESQSVGPVDAPMAVHLELLEAEVVLLEGIRLTQVPEGVYLLHAAPLNLAGAEGAPCRATLLQL